MLIGMASKNAILIVEFANQNRDLGMTIKKAAIFASEQRFRAILMTGISTLVGFVPLLIASGAGSVSRWSLGTAVFGGMLVATALSLIFVPILYIVIKNFEHSFLQGGGRKKQQNIDLSTTVTKSNNGINREQAVPVGNGHSNGNGNGHSNGNGKYRQEDREDQKSKANN